VTAHTSHDVQPQKDVAGKKTKIITNKLPYRPMGKSRGVLPPQKIFEVFGVKECILVHFSQRNIELFLAILVHAVPAIWNKNCSVYPRGRQESKQWWV